MDALYVGWTSEEKLADEGYLLFFRSVRNKLLSECDWTQVPDAPLTEEKRAEWRTYRQALRDLPDTTDIANPQFPQPPLTL
jgi:hypothetical protein